MAVDLRGRTLHGDEFEIREPIASGGMATVYTARQKGFEGEVAVKVLSPRFARSEEFRRRHHDEAEGIRKLHHPNIVEVYAVGEEDGILYIAMRFVKGGTLKQRLQELGGLMDLHSAAKLTAQVASALHYAHEQGMIHLDVKPANILLGKADWPLLSDFGIIRIAGDIRDEGKRIAGTPAYMSPEQWRGDDLDGRSDQYSLALMFYELVTGRRPFEGETSAELKEKHLHEPPPRPRELNPGIPGPVEEVMLRAMQKNPDDRFPTIADFGQALVEAVERSRGMQLETKQAIVAAAPNVVGLVGLSVVAPILASLPDPSLPVVGSLTLDWPVMLLTAVLQAALLMGIRWHLIGLASRLLGSVVDALDRFTRVYVRLGTDAEGPLQIKAWRNSVVGAAEGIVNVAYLFILYQLLGVPLVKTIAYSIRVSLEPQVATALTALVLLIAAMIVLKLARTSGSLLAVGALAICWGFISAMPVVDQFIWGQVSLQWLAKLVVGLGVLGAFLAVRPRAQRFGRGAIVPLITQQLAEVHRGQSLEDRDRLRKGFEQAVDGLVNVLFLIIGYSIIALPLRIVLDAMISDTLTVILITAGFILLAVLLLNWVRYAAGVVPATLGLLICAPTLMGLPLFTDSPWGGDSLRWVAQLLIGLLALGLFLSIHRRMQTVARAFIVPALDRQLSTVMTAENEDEEEARQQARLPVLGHASDMLVNVVYLLIGYFTVVGPVTGAIAGAANLAWVSAVIYALFVLAIVYVLVNFARRLLPSVRPAQGARGAPTAA